MDKDMDYEDDQEWDEDNDLNEGEEESISAEKQEEINKQIRDECLNLFESQDFIMEPDIIHHLKRFFHSGGNPEQVVDLLSRNYQATAQTANLLAEWLILTGLSLIS